MVLRPADIRAFVARDWEALEASKSRYWQSLGRGGDATESVRAADALRRHVARFAHGGGAPERELDLAQLLRFKRRIDAASAAFRR